MLSTKPTNGNRVSDADITLQNVLNGDIGLLSPAGQIHDDHMGVGPEAVMGTNKGRCARKVRRTRRL